ncbi:DUF1343 domain-containing protein [Cytophagales bacterium LB-30]|uniref:DUF1343 domain-containing protein n=1 Tax=Shiella aurantiaca TaxID=3058365 RepID=A0ABT8F3D8_9BACT|nr:DUF1343 domain-containing protein [Shiella aurantiaca]MDN4164965.1 DUF1343 domain-containing protein [Shiella aurantiaca]
MQSATTKVLFFVFLLSLGAVQGQAQRKNRKNNSQIEVGAARLKEYIPQIKKRKVAVVVNQSSMVGKDHLVDVLLKEKVDVMSIMVPEHGFRGDADAGEKVKDGLDKKTKLPVISLYGDNKKPKPEQLQGLEFVIFDLQDVGVRFYTYISTLHYVMEACAENNITLIVLDRPNPNGDYVDGPVLQKGYESFVGMHPIPVVHGLTVGELALMINGEKWLKEGLQCKLQVIKMNNWDHSTAYELPIKPSPNLPNNASIRLYPSLCLFEGTIMSVGRGTEFPFQVVGYPDVRFGSFSFTPKSLPGMAKNPLYENKTCYGLDLRLASLEQGFTLKYLLMMYQKSGERTDFFNTFLPKLIGNGELSEQIKAGLDEEEIRISWAEGLYHYKQMRKKYLLYPDFE